MLFLRELYDIDDPLWFVPYRSRVTVHLEAAILEIEMTAIVIALPAVEPLLTTARTLAPQLVRFLPRTYPCCFPGRNRPRKRWAMCARYGDTEHDRDVLYVFFVGAAYPYLAGTGSPSHE